MCICAVGKGTNDRSIVEKPLKSTIHMKDGTSLEEHTKRKQKEGGLHTLNTDVIATGKGSCPGTLNIRGTTLVLESGKCMCRDKC